MKVNELKNKLDNMLGDRHIHISDDSETTALGIPDDRFNELMQEIETTKEIDNAISDIVDAKATEEETIKIPYKTKQVVDKYHELKVSDLPLYKKYKLHDDITWYYRLSIIDGKQKAHRMSVNTTDNDVSLYYIDLEDIFADDNKDSNAEEWHAAVCKLLKIID
tara:strand:- start:73 stop:564 length:492 start_codon:yes stop_codon:yes gene_type:complete